MKKIKLFCIPFAGGSALVYNQWKNNLNKDIIVIPVELAGRGRRFSVPFYNDFDEGIKDIFSILKNEIGSDDYALFGHSMGCFFVYELYRELIHAGFKEPVHVFLSGRYPPCIKKGKVMHTLPDDEFLDEIVSYGGIPDEVLNNKDLLELSIKIIRSDYRILESYKNELYKKIKFNTNITVFGGIEDSCVSITDLYEWKNYSAKDFNVIEFDSGHFFINDKMDELLEIVNKILIKYLLMQIV